MAALAGATHNAIARTDSKAIAAFDITSSPRRLMIRGIYPAFEWAALRRYRLSAVTAATS
jgi:hypothetical protein